MQTAPIRPRILLDGLNLALDRGTGVATYARNLSYRLGALGAEIGVLYGNRASAGRDPVLREVTFFDQSERKVWLPKRVYGDIKRATKLRINPQAVEVPATGLVVRDAFDAQLPHFDRLYNIPELFRAATLAYDFWPRLIEPRLPHQPAVAHWTYPVPLRIRGALNIYTIHDLVPLRLPYTTLDNKRRYLRLCREIARSADHIVTVSEHSKRDIVEILGVPEERVTNTYQTAEIPARFAAKTEAQAAAEVEGAFGLGWKGYWLFFGAIEPKKNVGRLIEAFLASGSDAPLVVLGKKAWQSEEELRLLPEDNASDALLGPEVARRRRVIRLDYAPFRLLISVIRGARGLLFPSLYEGFGLPVLEAMKLGTPVITSDTSSLPEVVGDAAVTVSPYDTEAIAAAIRLLDQDAGLREELSRRGPVQAARFSPERYDERLRALYAKLGVTLSA